MFEFTRPAHLVLLSVSSPFSSGEVVGHMQLMARPQNFMCVCAAHHQLLRQLAAVVRHSEAAPVFSGCVQGKPVCIWTPPSTACTDTAQTDPDCWFRSYSSAHLTYNGKISRGDSSCPFPEGWGSGGASVFSEEPPWCICVVLSVVLLLPVGFHSSQWISIKWRESVLFFFLAFMLNPCVPRSLRVAAAAWRGNGNICVLKMPRLIASLKEMRHQCLVRRSPEKSLMGASIDCVYSLPVGRLLHIQVVKYLLWWTIKDRGRYSFANNMSTESNMQTLVVGLTTSSVILLVENNR